MKKKVYFYIIIGCLIFGICLFAWTNRTFSVITLDINPSIEINLNKRGKIVRVKDLNNDAKDVISNNLRGKTIDDGIDILTNNLVDNGYAEDRQIVIILYATGNVESNNIENLIRKNLDEKQIHSDIITIDNITKEDQKLAKEKKISLAKASYINSILEENKKIEDKSLIYKSANELVETKKTGKYCDEDYFLEGDFCFKEINRVVASNGKVCPNGYYDYNGVCYEEIGIEDTDKLLCNDEFSLDGNKCYRTVTIEAEPLKYSCPSGEAKTRAEIGLTNDDAGDANNVVCVDYSSATHPQSPCELNDGTEYTVYGGKCYWHRAPVIESGCPGKILVNGMCWDDASNIYICSGYRDGKQYSSRDEYCENSIKYIDPIVTEYKCPNDFTLNNNKCEKEEVEDAWHERVCPAGYTKTENDRCINYNKIVDKEDGLTCKEDNTKIKDNMCIIYDIVEAKK